MLCFCKWVKCGVFLTFVCLYFRLANLVVVFLIILFLLKHDQFIILFSSSHFSRPPSFFTLDSIGLIKLTVHDNCHCFFVFCLGFLLGSLIVREQSISDLFIPLSHLYHFCTLLFFFSLSVVATFVAVVFVPQQRNKQTSFHVQLLEGTYGFMCFYCIVCDVY